MKIIKNTLLGIGAVSALAITYAASEFDWHLGLMRENPVLFLKTVLNAFILYGSSAFTGGVLLVIATHNSWVKRFFNEWLLFVVFFAVGLCLITVCDMDTSINIMDHKIYREIKMMKCRKAAERGDANAQYRLGSCYSNGDGVETNEVEAVRWYRMAAEQYHKAAEQGEADAQYRLGTCYAFGDGVETNEAEALKWYHKAAEQGHEGAKGQLVAWYKLEEDRAVKWYRKAEVGWYRTVAEQGCVIAQFRLGMYYATGTGVEQNQEKAEEWFDKIKDPFDQFMIGNCFLAPLHFDFIRDEVMAMKWYRKAAEQGFADAQYMLGLCYCVKQDKPEAVKWLQKAAKQGHEKAKKALTEVSKQKGAEPK